MIETPFFVMTGMFAIYLVISQVTLHRLINKIMSGHYSTYQAADNIGKTKRVVTQGETGPTEDLGYLSQVVS